jgi:hypothetical protein
MLCMHVARFTAMCPPTLNVAPPFQLSLAKRYGQRCSRVQAALSLLPHFGLLCECGHAPEPSHLPLCKLKYKRATPLSTSGIKGPPLVHATVPLSTSVSCRCLPCSTPAAATTQTLLTTSPSSPRRSQSITLPQRSSPSRQGFIFTIGAPPCSYCAGEPSSHSRPSSSDHTRVSDPAALVHRESGWHP